MRSLFFMFALVIVAGCFDAGETVDPNFGKATSSTATGSVANAVTDIAHGGTGVTTAAEARTALGLKGAATLDAGTGAGNVVALDTSAKLPAVDGSQLTNMPIATGGIPHGVQIFNAAGTFDFDVPPGATRLFVEIIGGGGAGAGQLGGVALYAGGGGGAYCAKVINGVPLGARYYATVGAGGASGGTASISGSPGGQSSFCDMPGCTGPIKFLAGGGGAAGINSNLVGQGGTVTGCDIGWAGGYGAPSGFGGGTVHGGTISPQGINGYPPGGGGAAGTQGTVGRPGAAGAVAVWW